jgi:hypothetical protein
VRVFFKASADDDLKPLTLVLSPYPRGEATIHVSRNCFCLVAIVITTIVPSVVVTAIAFSAIVVGARVVISHVFTFIV